MKIARLWVPICLAGLVVGCGQKGPLVHPDAPKHKRVVPPSAPAPTTPGTNTPSTSAPAGTAPGTAAPSPPPPGTPPNGTAPAATDPPPNP